VTTATDTTLARALKHVLARETDPRARAWLRGLIRGDAPPKPKKAKK
jgi:hypothetical protein